MLCSEVDAERLWRITGGPSVRKESMIFTNRELTSCFDYQISTIEFVDHQQVTQRLAVYCAIGQKFAKSDVSLVLTL